MTKIERNKDTYICINGKGKKSYYNIATGEKIGYNGKALKRISSTLAPFTKICFDTPQKEFIDRLISLGELTLENLCGTNLVFSGNVYAEKCSRLMEKSEWKKTIALLSKVENRECYSFENLVNALCMLSALNKASLPVFKNIDFEYITIKDNWYPSRIINCCSSDWAKKALVKWMKRVDNNFEEIVKAHYALYETDRLQEIQYSFFGKIDTLNLMIEWKKEFPELSYDEKKSISENRQQWEKDMKILKDKKASEIFTKTQTAKDYSFASGNYSITVPTTYEDCQKISSVFHNCVAHYYWQNYLSKGKRVVVVVNKDGQPAICCSFDVNSMKIVDYLKPYNDSANNLNDIDFRKAYQNYLISLK